MSSKETGGLADVHIILWGYNNSLIDIQKNVSTNRILKLGVKVTFWQMTYYAIFQGNNNTQKI